MTKCRPMWLNKNQFLFLRLLVCCLYDPLVDVHSAAAFNLNHKSLTFRLVVLEPNFSFNKCKWYTIGIPLVFQLNSISFKNQWTLLVSLWKTSFNFA